MPLLNRKPYKLEDRLEELKDDDEVFFIKYTKEVFKSYESYIYKVNQYLKPIWSCAYTGKGNLTYEDALEEEEKALKSLDKFPAHLEETVCKAIHHSTKRLDDLVATIYDALRPAASQPSSDPIIATPTTSPSKTPSKAAKAPISKGILRIYIIKNATQQGPEHATKLAWTVSKELVDRCKLPTELPRDIADLLLASVKVPKKRPVSGGTGADADGGTKKAKASKDKDASSKENEKRKQPSIPDGRIPVTAKPLEEVEGQYQNGTIKHILVAVLKSVKPQGLTTQGVIDKAKELGLREFEQKHKVKINQCLSLDPNFCRLEKGLYSLHAFHPDVVVYAKPPLEKKRKSDDAAAGSRKKASQESGGAVAAGDQDAVEEELDDLAKAGKVLKAARTALTRHRSSLEKAAATYDETKEALSKAKKDQTKSPSKENRRESDVDIPAEALARFELKEEEREFQGDPDDRKAMLEHRQKLQSRVRELEKAKKEFIEGERAKHDAAMKESLAGVKQQEAAFRKAERALQKARSAVETAEKAVVTAEKHLLKEQEKAKKAADRENYGPTVGRPPKKPKKKYPIEDLEVLEELKNQATSNTGHSSSSFASKALSLPAPATEGNLPFSSFDIYQPTWLDTEEASRLSTCLYIADVLSQFGRPLGIKSLGFVELLRLLRSSSFAKNAAIVASSSTTSSSSSPTHAIQDVSTLYSTYLKILQVVLGDLREEGVASAAEKRWSTILSEGTWPEVLRRLVLTRASYDQPYARPDKRAALAAGLISFDGVDGLTQDQHVYLLRFLVDELLDSGKLRTILQKREDDATDAKRDTREDMAEERRRLRELDEAEKEDRRRKREEEKAKQEAAATADGQSAAPSRQQSICPSWEGQQQRPAEAACGEEEPSFELPLELRDFKGNPENKKQLLKFRQDQQAARRMLEKQRNKWMAEQLRKQREEDARIKEAKNAELAREKERESAEEALALAQEALEEKMEKLALRRIPMGEDRYHRRYWWGLASHRPALYVEDMEGRWGVYSTLEDISHLMASLERRGVRELALAQTLEKKYEAIATAMKRSSGGEIIATTAAVLKDGGDDGVDQHEGKRCGNDCGDTGDNGAPVRQSSRNRMQVQFYDPSKDLLKSEGNTSEKKGRSASGLQAIEGMGVSEAAALEDVVMLLEEMQQLADTAEVPCHHSDDWEGWLADVSAAGDGLVDGAKARSPADVCKVLIARAIDLEASLMDVTKGALESGNEEDDDSDAGHEEHRRCADNDGDDEDDAVGEDTKKGLDSESLEVLEEMDDAFSPTKASRDVTLLWRTSRERAMWLSDAKAAACGPRIAYCCAVLKLRAMPLLRTLRKKVHGATPVGKKSSGYRKKKPATGGNLEKKGGIASKAKKEPFRERPANARRSERHLK